MSPPTYAWDIIVVIPHPHTPDKQIEASQTVIAPDIKTVWEYLAPDLQDAATEIIGITRGSPIIAILPIPLASS